MLVLSDFRSLLVPELRVDEPEVPLVRVVEPDELLRVLVVLLLRVPEDFELVAGVRLVLVVPDWRTRVSVVLVRVAGVVLPDVVWRVVVVACFFSAEVCDWRVGVACFLSADDWRVAVVCCELRALLPALLSVARVDVVVRVEVPLLRVEVSVVRVEVVVRDAPDCSTACCR